MTWLLTPAFRAALGALLFAGLPFASGAQVVAGSLLDAVNRPIPGVIVLLVDSASRVAARGLSDANGEFRVLAHQAGTYRLRTLRIGFRPALSDPVVLVAGGEVVKRLVLTGLPIVLDTTRIVDQSVCRAFTDSGAATYAVWEQIRAALTAAQLTTSARAITVTTVSYERTVGARPGENDGKVLRQSSTVQTGYARRPWHAAPPDSLRKFGYVSVQPDKSVVYLAPDLDVLLSASFVEDHCFRLVLDREHGGRVGISFEPVPDRRRLPEIRGTMWVERASSELRSLEYQYVHLSQEVAGQAPGGTLKFARLRDGTWAISDWGIEIPVAEQVILPGRPPEWRVTRLERSGGELALARRGNDTLWTGSRHSIAGTVRDSLTGSPVARARVVLSGSGLQDTSDDRGRFKIDGVLAGEYRLEAHTLALDSLAVVAQQSLTVDVDDPRVDVNLPDARHFVASVCGIADTHDDKASGIVLGRARVRSDSATPRNLRVILEWSEPATDTTQPDTAAIHTHRLETRGTIDGSFRFCGVHPTATLRLWAVADDAETAEPKLVRFRQATRLLRADLTLDRPSASATSGAVFTGIVITDSSRAPIAAAEVALPELGKDVLTDALGEFRLIGIPAGEHRVRVRRMGYGAADARVMFGPGETVERRIVLGRAVTLEPVTVSERAIDRTMASFEENRHVGLGHFLTRAELAKYTGMKLTGILAQIPGLDLINGSTTGTWVTSRRGPAALCPPGPTGSPPDHLTPTGRCLESHGYYVPDDEEARRGVAVACYALVYLDGVLMNGVREPTEPFDVSTIPPERVEGLEFYAGAAETPLQYGRVGSNCGVLVIWTRRPS